MKLSHVLSTTVVLGASQGRALDGAAKINYDLTKRFYVGAGVRVLDGGAELLKTPSAHCASKALFYQATFPIALGWLLAKIVG